MTTEPPMTEPPLPECQVTDENRVECGFSGITEEICVGEDVNCCWSEPDNTDPEAGFPWCFVKDLGK